MDFPLSQQCILVEYSDEGFQDSIATKIRKNDHRALVYVAFRLNRKMSLASTKMLDKQIKVLWNLIVEPGLCS